MVTATGYWRHGHGQRVESVAVVGVGRRDAWIFDPGLPRSAGPLSSAGTLRRAPPGPVDQASAAQVVVHGPVQLPPQSPHRSIL